MPKTVRRKSVRLQTSRLVRKRLTMAILAAMGVVVVAALAFLAYAYVHNGSIQGFLLENQAFPGANAPSLVEGRQQVRATLAKSNAAVTSLAPIYASGLVTNEDGCEKGTHDTALSIEPRNDNFAYDCSIDTIQYYAFSQAHCDVTKSLLELSAVLGGSNCDTSSSSNDRVYSNVRSKYDGGPMVSIIAQDVTEFKLQNKNTVIDKSPFNPCNNSTRKVYCNSQDIPTEIVDKIPASAQTVVTVSVEQGTYYRK